MSSDVTARLEAVATRLERVAKKLGGGGGGSDDSDVPMWVTDYESIVKKEVTAACDACNKLKIPDVAALLKQAYDNNLDLVKRAPNAKKPAPKELQEFLGPGIDAITKLDNMRYKGTNTKKYGDHYKAMYDAVLMVSWVTQSPPMGLPAQHCDGQMQSTDFNMNRVLKNNKSQETKDWIKSMKALNKKVVDYVKEYFKSSGLIWNAKGGSLSDAKSASSTSTGPGTKSNDDSKQEATSTKKGYKKTPKKPAGGGMGAVFASLSKGTDITKGMNKVTKDMKTKNRKNRSGKVVAKTAKKKVRKKFGPPQTKFFGGRWMVENYEDGVIQVEKANIKSNVFITMCDTCTVQVQNKVKAITIDNCVKVRVFVSEVVSTVEIVNSKSVTVIVQKKAPSIAVDKSESPCIILSRSAFECEPDIYTSNVSAMNVEIPGKTDNDDNVEHPIPEQFLTKIDAKTGKITTKPTKH